MKTHEKPFLRELKKLPNDHIPFWFMRQAGRYLPEYRALRAQAGGFLDLVYNPKKASEVTIQPIRRFGMDAAILFSDILVIPQALGQDLKFEVGEGPKLNSISKIDDLQMLDASKIDDVLSPIYDTISLTRSKLKEEFSENIALIGFAGSPWTVACYMVEGGGSKTFSKTKNWAQHSPDEFQKIINLLVEATSHYLIKQIEAGAEAIQLFDSWAGILDKENFQRWVINPTIEIVKNARKKYPDISIIGFPREAGEFAVLYAEQTAIDAIGMDYSMNIGWARENLQNILPVQGNLDPKILLEGGIQMEKAAFDILEKFSDKPFIFNLGHGIIKETPPENVERLCQIIKGFKR